MANAELLERMGPELGLLLPELESVHFRGHFHYAAFGAQLSNWRS